MDDKAILQAMAQMLDPIRQDINEMKEDLTRLNTKMDEMAEELHEVRGAQNVIAGWVESLQTDVKSLNDLHSA